MLHIITAHMRKYVNKSSTIKKVLNLSDNTPVIPLMTIAS